MHKLVAMFTNLVDIAGHLIILYNYNNWRTREKCGAFSSICNIPLFTNPTVFLVPTSTKYINQVSEGFL